MIKQLFIFLVLMSFTALQAAAQCAMCRSTVANNVSNGDQVGLAAGLNTGIIYLFVTPYLLVAVVGFIWYRKAMAKKKTLQA